MSRLELQIVLEEIGFSEKEATVYLACIELGTSLASVIAKRAKVNRCTAYDVLEKLFEKGLVVKSVKNENNFYCAEDLEKLFKYFREKKRNVEKQLQAIETNLYKFKQIKTKGYLTPKIIMLEDVKKIREVRNEMDSEETLKIIPSKNLLIKGKERRVLALNSNQSSPEIYICKNTVVIISDENSFVIIIKDEGIAKLHTNIFKLLWERSGRKHTEITPQAHRRELPFPANHPKA